jgi:hypothetical protein
LLKNLQRAATNQVFQATECVILRSCGVASSAMTYDSLSTFRTILGTLPFDEQGMIGRISSWVIADSCSTEDLRKFVC